MGHVNTQITLKNVKDVFKAKEGNLPEDKIRQATIDVMVDTGASMLVIDEKILQQIGAGIMEESEITLANDAKEKCKVTDPLVIKWEDRSIVMPALVIENSPDFLLGVLPLEGMDLIVDTVNQKLIGAHGKKPVYRA